MIKKLLNKKNLIIVVVCLVILLFPNISFAETTEVSISTLLKQTIAGWYYVVKYVCLAIMLIAFIVLGIKAAISTLAEDRAVFKEMLVPWITGMLLLLCLEYIIYAAIYFNEFLIDQCRTLGESLAEVGEYANVDEYEEVTLYESAISKAYELKFTSGTLGMIMYIVLLYYTIRFFFVYVRRYVNVVVLILLGPIIVTVHVFKKILQGKKGNIGRWLKELIYNIYIQVIHALFYSMLIGLTIKFGNESTVLSYFGSILTLIVFAFIFHIDGFIRKLFNFVGGKSTVEARDYSSIIRHPIQSVKDEASYLSNQAKQIPEKVKDTVTSSEIYSGAVKVKNSVVSEVNSIIEPWKSKDSKLAKQENQEAQNANSALNKEKNKSSNLLKKALNTTQDVAYGVAGAGLLLAETITAKSKKELLKIKQEIKNKKDGLNQDDTAIRKLKRILTLNKTRKSLALATASGNNDLSLSDKLKATVIDDMETPEEEAKGLKTEIENNVQDITALIYSTFGLSVFIYPELGSTQLGISVLASSRNEEKNTRVVKKMGVNKKRIAKPKLNEEQKIKTKIYKFSRFNYKSIRTISKSLNRRMILNSSYLSTMAVMQQKMASGNVTYSGVYTMPGYTGVKRTSVKYKSKITSYSKNENIVKLELGAKAQGKSSVVTEQGRPGEFKNQTQRQEQTQSEEPMGQIIPFASIKERKLKAYAEVSKYHERVEDSKWAVMGEMSNEAFGMQVQGVNVQAQRADTQTQIINMQAQKMDMQVSQTIQEINRGEISIESLTDIGQAAKIDNDSYIIFDDNYDIKNASIEQKNERITDVAIVDAVMKFNTTLEKLDVTNRNVQDEILNTLSDKGVVNYEQVQSNEATRAEFTQTIAANQEKLLVENREEYERLVIRKEIANVLIEKSVVSEKSEVPGALETSEISEVPKISENTEKTWTELLDQVVQNVGERSNALKEIVQNSDKTKMVKEAASDFVQVEAEEFKENLEYAKDVAKEELKKAKELFFEKDPKLKKARKEFVEKAEKRKNDEYDKDDILLIFIYGEIVNPGEYNLILGSRIRDAISAAGGITPEADVEKVIEFQDNFLSDGEVVFIPKRTDEDLEDLYERCEPVVEKVVKEYIQENEISNPESLRKLKHKNQIISKLQRELRNEEINKAQIEQLFEKRIEEIIKIRGLFEENAGSIQIINKNQVNESDKTELDNAFRRFNSMSREEREEVSGTTEQTVTDINSEMSTLLNQIREESNNSLKTEARKQVKKQLMMSMNMSA